MTEIILHQWEVSPFCSKIRSILEHKGIPYRVQNYNGLLSLRAKKLSPAGKLPVLDINGERTQDSRRIAALLEQRFPTPALVPTDATERAQMEILQDWADESLYWYEVYFRAMYDEAWDKLVGHLCNGRPFWEKSIFNTVARPQFRSQLQAQGIGRIEKSVVEARFMLLLHSLDAQLAGRTWLVGEYKTLADIAIASQLNEIKRTSHLGAAFANNVNVHRWLQTL
jgi:glutathione S-transferase